jgi:hypothetical protein
MSAFPAVENPITSLKPSEALAQLRKWKNECTRLYLSCSECFMALCLGYVDLASESTVIYMVHGIDSKNLLFNLTLHQARFELLNNEDGLLFNTIRRDKSSFGVTLRLTLSSGQQVILTEVYDSLIIEGSVSSAPIVIK